jgi:hypothetical protein
VGHFALFELPAIQISKFDIYDRVAIHLEQGVLAPHPPGCNFDRLICQGDPSGI